MKITLLGGIVGNRVCKECRNNGGHDSKGDHLWLLKDGTTWGCFRKEYHANGKAYFERADGTSCSMPSQREAVGRESVSEVQHYPIFNSEYRGIRGETFKFFEVRCSFNEENGSVEHLYFPIKSNGKLLGFHRRSMESKAFINIGPVAGATLDLFGIDKCAKSGKNIVITEGQLDCLSVYQIIKDKYSKINPNIVSINSGIGMMGKDLATSQTELMAYESVLLSFDMDVAGREAIGKVSKLLGNKIKVMELSVKDANEALTSGKSHEVINSLFNPREYMPSDIITLADIYQDILKETPSGVPYPWEGLTELTYGLFPNQIISVAASAGAGKTVFMNQLAAYFIEQFKIKIALFSLEETPAYTAKKLVGSLIQKKIHLPGVSVDPEEIDVVYKKLKDYLYIYDTQGFLSWEDIRNNIRYLASLECKVFIIDPLTAVTAMCSASEANEVLNSMMAELSGIVQALGITVFLVSHLNNPKTGKAHSEGGRVVGEQLTGSRAMTRWSHLIIGLERNQQAEDEVEKNTVVVRVIKNRMSGKTGVVSLAYSTNTGLLEEVEELNLV